MAKYKKQITRRNQLISQNLIFFVIDLELVLTEFL